MNRIKDILKGVLIGIANIIPGVSGGTMMVSMGIYDKIISCITGILRDFKKCIKILLPYAIGMVIGLVGVSFLIKYFNATFPLQTACVFIGLILGGCPIMLKNYKGKKISFSYIIAFILFFALIIGLQLLGGKETTDTTITLSFLEVIKLFAVGVIASATMVIPGVSGSMILMILGYYNPIITTLTDCFKALAAFDFKTFFDCVFILLPFGIGVILGILAIAKLIEMLFKNYRLLTFSAILGLVIASPVAILMQLQLASIHVLTILASILCFGVGFIISFLLGKES